MDAIGASLGHLPYSTAIKRPKVGMTIKSLAIVGRGLEQK
ncbi:hypothetical protein Rumeso_03633 [Rubellimicrobium mesophilum DSM 19309]|uniref:Uncharacterized protein n=1 Tax=Rubellimicrobium mesophilum DSM 19309 TaxID=442562 RepID=A0A017HKV3_9RHOB|nr:hypothetical protein Rumeso_03633 [Rubellimicrobium mesophilum DSM 19309]